MFAIKVIWRDGEEEYAKEGIETAKFYTREFAQEMVDFMMAGMDKDTYQSVNIVPYRE